MSAYHEKNLKIFVKSRKKYQKTIDKRKVKCYRVNTKITEQEESFMNKTRLLERVANNEELTVKEVREYQKYVKPEKQVYGKYGSLARIHIEENKPEMLIALAGQLPEYLHGIDRQAADLYDTMYAKLSKAERFKKTGDFVKDLQIETEIKGIIETEILNELIYTI